MNWKASRMNRENSSESDLSSLSDGTFSAMPTTKIFYSSSHFNDNDSGFDQFLQDLPMFNFDETHGNEIEDDIGSEGFSVEFNLSDCNDTVDGSIDLAAQDNAVIITPNPSSSTQTTPPATPMSSRRNCYCPSSYRSSAVKCSDLVANYLHNDGQLPVCLTSVFAMDHGDVLLSPSASKELNRYPYDLDSPATKVIMSATVDKLFVDSGMAMAEDYVKLFDSPSEML